MRQYKCSYLKGILTESKNHVEDLYGGAGCIEDHDTANALAVCKRASRASNDDTFYWYNKLRKDIEDTCLKRAMVNGSPHTFCYMYDLCVVDHTQYIHAQYTPAGECAMDKAVPIMPDELAVINHFLLMVRNVTCWCRV